MAASKAGETLRIDGHVSRESSENMSALMSITVNGQEIAAVF